jgi:hypothetical protein
MAGRYRGQHKTVLVKENGFEARIDKNIAPLIRELWRADIFTFNCCEENRPGIMWIQFASVFEAEMFLNIVARYEEGVDNLYNRIRQEWSREDGIIPGAWVYDVYPTDFSVEQRFLRCGCIEERSTGPCEFSFSMSIRFPKGDYPVLLERMLEYNASPITQKKGEVA